MREIEAMIVMNGRQGIVSYEDHAVIPKANSYSCDVFIRMELLTSLPSFLNQNDGRLSQEQVVKLGIDIASALEVMQKHGYIHHDIKPANILMNADSDFKLEILVRFAKEAAMKRCGGESARRITWHRSCISVIKLTVQMLISIHLES